MVYIKYMAQDMLQSDQELILNSSFINKYENEFSSLNLPLNSLLMYNIKRENSMASYLSPFLLKVQTSPSK